MNIPIWRQTPTQFICEDAKTGKTLSVINKPILPDGSFMEPFKSYKVKLLKPVLFNKRGKKEYYHPIGFECVAQTFGQTISLGIEKIPGLTTSVLLDAKLGVDFEFI